MSMQKRFIPALAVPLVTLCGCAQVNAAITDYDARGDRLVSEYVDNSKVNQVVGASFDQVGNMINGAMPLPLQATPENISRNAGGELPNLDEWSKRRSATQAAVQVADNANLSQAGGGGTEAAKQSEAKPVPRAQSARRDNRLVVLDGVVVPRGMKILQAGGTARSDSNIRMGPGTNHQIVRRVPAGALLFATAVAPNGWYMLEEDGRVYGYISGTLFKPAR